MLAFLRLLIVAQGVVLAAAADDACEDDGSLSLLQLGHQAIKVDAATIKQHKMQEPEAQGVSLSAVAETPYPWSQRGRDYTQSSFTPLTAPTDLSTPTWSWPNPDDEQVRHSPLIDNNKDIYVSTGWKIRKFGSDADADGNPVIKWSLDTHLMVASPALYKGALYAVEHTSPESVNILSVNMSTGTVRWNETVNRKQDGDASSVFVYNDTILFAVQPDTKDAPSIHNVYAADAADGHKLWEFAPDDALWNFAPSSPGDGTILFAGDCGRAYQVTFEGKLLWKNGPASTGMCGTGGGAMGPNGVFYNVYNTESGESPKSFISARSAQNGTVLWTKDVSHRNFAVGNQYPAVGMIGGKLAVVAALGPNTAPSPELKPLTKDELLPNSVLALDAETGKEIWRYDEAPWAHLMAAGDERILGRIVKKATNPKTDVMCLPDTQGIPLIAGDGTVYMSSSHGGELRAINDKNGDGKIDPSEVSSFSTDNCFLNSPSLAQGMLVAAPCWGPMHVFKE